MKVLQNLLFVASPEKVSAMLVNPDFAKFVGVEVGATGFEATQVEGGLTSRYQISTPRKASGILGPDLIVDETVTWESPTQGRLLLTVEGVPAKVDGALSLSPSPTGCTAMYDADFKVKIPIIGKKIEQLAGEYLTKIVAACETVGNRWLTSH
ncbi:MAG: DUF2505 domain-containing protein [Propionibacteriaceae bacterium]|jgi:hypothetical protein|nr:DUF2505 domain-containing protein [Propionibacteriaceae bacterium]